MRLGSSLAAAAAVSLLCGTRILGATFTVTDFRDNGAGTLRQAIQDNNNDPGGGGNTIVFDPAVLQSGLSNITLATGELVITKDVTISGPGANLLSITGPAGAVTPSRVFNIHSGATTNISGLHLANGQSSTIGGAIVVNGTLIMTNCELSDNSAPGSSGGAIYGLGTGSSITLNGCTFNNNSADYAGAVGADGSLAMVNCTVTNNRANNHVGGGGIATFTKLVLQSCTIVGNHADVTDVISGTTYQGQGGGVYIDGGTVTIQNTIVSGNTAAGTAKDVFGPVTSRGYNIVSNTAGSSGFNGIGDQLNISAALGPLQDNGGGTNTMAPVLGSNAIDQGKASYPGGLTLTSDQRGFARTIDQPDVPDANQGDATDVGAVEIGQRQKVSNLVVNSVSGAIGICTESDCTLPSAVAVVNSDGAGFTGPGTTITFAPGLVGSVKLTQTLQLEHAATIAGPTANTPIPVVTLDGKNNVTILYTFSDLTMSYLGLYRGKASKISSGQLNAGAIENDTGHLTLTNCLFESNDGLVGGAIYNDHGIVNLTNCNFLGNAAQYGGAIGNEGSFDASRNTTLSLTNCSFLVNAASAVGGAISSAGSDNGSATIVLRNCTFFSDSAPAGQGGEIDQATNGTGAAILDLANTIFQPQDGGSITSTMATVTSRGHNLASDAAGGDGGTGPGGLLSGPGDIRNTDPKFTGGLLNNGGSALSIPIAPESPAVDAADPNYAPPTDERGFARVGAPDIGVYESGSAGPPAPTPTPTPTPTATAAPPSQLLNLSTRKRIGTGDNVLIGGFIVVGTDDKKVLLRGLGPSLPVSGALADPVLELHRADTSLVAANDNWEDSQAAEIIATGIPPSSNLESAIVATLGAKPSSDGGAAYTGVLAGEGGTTGIGLLEVYDLDTAAASKLANISTRGFVGSGDDLLIGGFIPGPSDRAGLKVLVRALGPSLATQGVSGALQDPVLELHDANGIAVQNDNWRDASNASEVEATLPPPDDHESAIITTLVPSNSGYTAVLRGVNNSTGVALVEVYALQ